MQRRTSWILAALGAAALLPGAGAFAEERADTTEPAARTSADTAGMKDTVMDAGQFRDQLHRVKDLLSQIRENRDLALAAQDPLIAGQYQSENRRLMTQTLGILDVITKHWRRSELPNVPGETSEMRASRSLERWGSADMQRYANESEDTAFVRNTVWNIQSELLGDKLNGREPIVSDRVWESLNAAIARAENPDFRVVRAFNRERLAQRIEFAQRETTAPAPSPTAETPREETRETTREETREETTVERAPAEAPAEQPTVTERETTTETTETAPAPTAEETTTEETTTTTDIPAREGSTDLPRTGGDPGMLVLFGSGLAGLGALLRRRR